MQEFSHSRRRFMGLAAGGAALCAARVRGDAHVESHASGASLSPEPDPSFIPEIELEMTAAEQPLELLPGQPTRLWRYQIKVLQGDPASAGTLPGGVVPFIRARNGQRIRIIFHNALPEESIVHWHGLHIPQKMDGHPMYVIGTGRRYVYEFVVHARAGSYWFHPHPHRRTGIQVYRGLSGLFIVGDEEEDAAELPSGPHDIAWVLQDRVFSRDNQLVYARNHMQMMSGYTGDRILVNGRPGHVESVAATAYRVRILNGSNARFYKLALDDNRPLTVIGTDGGLLETPVEKPFVMLAPAERVDLWLDFSRDGRGREFILRSLPITGVTMQMGPGMGGGMGRGMGMMAGGLPNGAPLDLLKVRVDRAGETPRPLPRRLSSIRWPDQRRAVNRDAPRTIRLQMAHGSLTLNGRTFDMQDVTPEETVRLGTTEIWEFVNVSGGMSHPMHVHNLQFRVIERLRDRRYAGVHDSMREGLVDEGPKDVVIVMPGERVRVAMSFTDHAGLYLYHCHILEHEDLGMMRNYLVEG